MATFDYKAAMKELRGKIAFDYPLNRKLTPGQKSAIRRAYNSYRAVSKTSIQPLEIRRKRGETREQYARRFRKTKRELTRGLSADEQGKMLATASNYFILFSTKPGATITYRNNMVTLRKGDYAETYIPFNRDFGTNPSEAVWDALQRGIRAGIKPISFQIANGPFRWGGNISLLSWYTDTLGDKSKLREYFDVAMMPVLARLDHYTKAGQVSNAASGIWLIEY